MTIKIAKGNIGNRTPPSTYLRKKLKGSIHTDKSYIRDDLVKTL